MSNRSACLIRHRAVRPLVGDSGKHRTGFCCGVGANGEASFAGEVEFKLKLTRGLVRMTVIFHTNAGLPVLAGDMLLSIAGSDHRTELKIPSQPNGISVPSDFSPSYIPVRMRRKIFIVNKHLAVGVAGVALYASLFVDDLKTEFQDRSAFTNEEVRDFLDRYASSEYGKEVLEQCGALLLVDSPDWRGSLTKGVTNHGKFSSQNYGNVITIGTGSSTLVEQIRQLDNNYNYGMSQPSGGETRFPEFVALSRNLILLANLYWREFTNPQSIFDAWGGAYDLIYQDSDRVFQYLTDYSIILRVYDADRPDDGIRPTNILKYERRPEVSLIVMQNAGKLDFFGAKDITASDAPVNVSIKSGELTMNSKVHISIIAVGKGNRLLPPMIQIDGLDEEEETNQTVFTWFDEDGRLAVAFQAEHERWLEEQALSYYQRNAGRF